MVSENTKNVMARAAFVMFFSAFGFLIGDVFHGDGTFMALVLVAFYAMFRK